MLRNPCGSAPDVGHPETRGCTGLLRIFRAYSPEGSNQLNVGEIRPNVALRVQVPNNHTLTQNLYHDYYYPNPKYPNIGYLDP